MRCFVQLWLAVILALGLSSAALAAPHEWPHWNGPTRNAEWHEEGILDSFPESGPKVLWRAPINQGYSGPAVADGRLFVMDRIEDRDAPTKLRGAIGGIERCLCFHTITGELLWKHEHPCEYRISYPEGPRTTPSVSGDHVYFLGAMGWLACHEVATGKVVWEKELTQDYQTEPPVWGFAVHPHVDGDRLYCVVGGKGSAMVCFDRHSGEEIWKSHTAEEVGYAPPVMFEQDGVRQIIHWHDTGLVAANPETGEILWKHEFPGPAPMRPVVCISTPILAGDKLLVSDFYNGSVLLKLSSHPPAAKELWRSGPNDPQHDNDLNSLMSTLVVEQEHIYGIAGNGEMRCLKLEDQSLIWRNLQASSATRPTHFATSFLVKNGDRYFLFNDQGYLKIVHLDPSGYRESSSAQVIEPTGFARGRDVVWAHPAFADGKMFARNGKEIVCFDMRKA